MPDDNSHTLALDSEPSVAEDTACASTAGERRTFYVHMCLDIQGWLTNHPHDRDYIGMFRHDDGREMTPQEARNQLFDELRKGRKVLPYGQCEGFSYETGCPGHPADSGDVNA